MDLDTEIFDYNIAKNQGTGGYDISNDYKTIIYPFDKYQIKIKLTQDNKFIGITEIKINKDFLSHKQKIASLGFHDVDEFYRE
jgi:hypothetical protein